VPFEHVLPREIILHINWLTVGACRETGNRYSKYERSEYREYDYGIGACVRPSRWENLHISSHADAVVRRNFRPDNAVRKDALRAR